MADPAKLASGILGPLPNPKEVARDLEKYHKALDLLEPVVNQFHRAFGGMEELQTKITDLRNTVVKAKTVLRS